MEFSIQRVIQLIKRDILINSKVFSLLIIFLSLIGPLIMFMSTEEYCNSKHNIDIIDVLLISVICISGIILSASIFTEFRSASSRSHYLNLPASHLEKWLSKWLICVPIHLCISTLIFIISYMIMGSIIHNVWPECTFAKLSFINFPELSNLIKQYFIIQSLCFLLGVIYNKYAVIKSLSTAALLIFLFSMAVVFFVRTFLANDPDAQLKVNLTIFNISFVFTPAFWLASYYKLKEKQL